MLDLTSARDQFEHAIAVLIGQPASTFTLSAAPMPAIPPPTPPGLTSELLETLFTPHAPLHDGAVIVRNDRVIAVPSYARMETDVNHVRDLPAEMRTELKKFFVATDELEDKTLKFEGWVGPKRAKRLIKQCEKRFAKGKP